MKLHLSRITKARRSNTPSMSLRNPANTSLKPALDLETKDLMQNIEQVLYATNNEAKPPPILNENAIRMTNEPSAAHESHAQAAAKANAEGFQSPIQIMRAKKRRRIEREREKIQAVKLDANSRFRSTKPINPFSKSHIHAVYINGKMLLEMPACHYNNASSSNSSSTRQTQSAGSRSKPEENRKIPASQADIMRERQRQLQAIIAHAAKAGMDKPALQEVADNPG